MKAKSNGMKTTKRTGEYIIVNSAPKDGKVVTNTLSRKTIVDVEVSGYKFSVGLNKEGRVYVGTIVHCGLRWRAFESTIPKSIKEIEKHLTEYPGFIDVLKQQPKTIEDCIDNLQKSFDAEEKRVSLFNALIKIRGLKLPKCRYSYALRNQTRLDPVEMDRVMGVPENTSLNDFLVEKFGKDVAESVRSLI